MDAQIEAVIQAFLPALVLNLITMMKIASPNNGKAAPAAHAPAQPQRLQEREPSQAPSDPPMK